MPKHEEVQVTGLTSFYDSVLQSWQILRVSRDSGALSGMWIFEEPLFYNEFFCVNTLISSSLRSALREAGCTKLGHLLKAMHSSLVELRQLANIRSERLMKRIVVDDCESLPQSLREFAEDHDMVNQWEDRCEYIFPCLNIFPAVSERIGLEDGLLSFTNLHTSSFEELGKKEAYIMCVKELHSRTSEGMNSSRWFDFFGPDHSVKGFHLDPNQGIDCPFCVQDETLVHLFCGCGRLGVLFNLLKQCCLNWRECFSFPLFIFEPKYSVKKKLKHVLINLVFGAAKLSIWLSRKNKILNKGSKEVYEVFLGMLEARLRIECVYYELINNLQAFTEKWSVGNVLCGVDHDGVGFIFFIIGRLFKDDVIMVIFVNC